LRLEDTKEGESIRAIGLPVVEYLERRRTSALCTYVFPCQGEDNAFGSFPKHWKQLFKDAPVMSVHSRIGRLFGARAAAEEYSVASQLNCVPLVSFRRQITRSEITAEGSR
jgi:hypothetical protein